MLTYALAWIIAFASFGLYLTASAFPEVHRKNDYVLGGIGIFYALILWANAKTIPIGLLIGQIASVTLIIWLGRQSLEQRNQLADPDMPRPSPGSLNGRVRTLMVRVGQLWEPLVGIIGDLLSGSNDPELSEATPETLDEPPEATNILSQLGQTIGNVIKSATGKEAGPTLTVTASHEVEEADAQAQAAVTAQDSAPVTEESTEDIAAASSTPAAEPEMAVQAAEGEGEGGPVDAIATETPSNTLETPGAEPSSDAPEANDAWTGPDPLA